MVSLTKTLNLFIFADALGWELSKRYPMLLDLFPRQSPCDTVFGYSCTCDPTILTGRYPEEHGHFSFFVKATQEQPSPFKSLRWLGGIPEAIAGHHRIRSKVSQHFAKRAGYSGYFQLYSVPFRNLPHLDYTEKRDIYAPGGIIGGQSTIFDTWASCGKAWYRSDWRKGDQENIQNMTQVLRCGKVELAYLFTAGLDATMHRYGTDHPKVKQAFERFAEDIHSLHQLALKEYDQVYFHLFSDHGMCDTQQASDLLLRWRKQPWRYGEDYVAVWDSTMARFWFNNEQTRKEALTWLADQPDGKLLSAEQLRHWHCYFPDQRYGEAIYLLPPGALFVPSDLNQRWVAGMHGYDPTHNDSTACWMTNHPTRQANSLVDIHDLMVEAAYA